MYGTSSVALLKDLGWETLATRRERHKLTLFLSAGQWNLSNTYDSHIS